MLLYGSPFSQRFIKVSNSLGEQVPPWLADRRNEWVGDMGVGVRTNMGDHLLDATKTHGTARKQNYGRASGSCYVPKIRHQYTCCIILWMEPSEIR